MPKGYEAGKAVGDFTGRGSGFHDRPKGVTYFKLVNDQDQAIVRFLQQHEDINWVRQWRTGVKPNFPYGEKINCIDQFEDGTPDPGFEAGLKNTWTAFTPLIWRNCPQFQRDGNGRLVKDGNGNKVLSGYADQVCLWEHPWGVYEVLRTVEADYRGLMSRDFKITRMGAKGSNKVTYAVSPADPDGGPTEFSQQDSMLAQTQAIDIAPFVKIPTYEELYTYLNGGVGPAAGQAPTMPQGGVPIQHQQPAAAPAALAWPTPPGTPGAPPQVAPPAPPAPSFGADPSDASDPVSPLNPANPANPFFN